MLFWRSRCTACKRMKQIIFPTSKLNLCSESDFSAKGMNHVDINPKEHKNDANPPNDSISASMVNDKPEDEDANQYPVPLSPRPGELSKTVEFERAMLADAAMKAGPAISEANILYEDEWLMIVNKPCGVYSEHVLISVPYLWGHSYSPTYPVDNSNVTQPCQGGSVSRHLHLANRLDRDTSGILVITKCRTAAANLVKIFTTREIKKSYIALCVGSLPTWETITIESGHGRSKFGAWRIYAKRDVGRILPGGSHVKEMITCFSMVGYRKLSMEKKLKRCASLLSKANNKLIIVGENDNEVQRMAEAEGEPAKDESDMHHEVLVRAFPLTGRTHQIRLHCQHMGLSLRGDAKYGGPLLLNGEQYSSHALHAETIAFEHPLTFQKIDIAAPIPPWAKGFEIGLSIN